MVVVVVVFLACWVFGLSIFVPFMLLREMFPILIYGFVALVGLGRLKYSFITEFLSFDAFKFNEV